MSESEKLQQQIDSLESEQQALATDLATLEGQIEAAEADLDTLYATAERQPSPEASAAVDATETELAAMRAMARRKRAALTAATTDAATARRALAEAKRGAALIALQSALDELSALAAAVDDDPTDLAAWAALRAGMVATQARFRAAGGKGTIADDPLQVYKDKLGALVTQVDFTMREPGRALPVHVPRMSDLMRLGRAAGLVRQLMSVN